ncbi:hypothetical protein CA13_65880 [Planctomycetes bacterium CA13]|uniref:Uncharacterized protein n=1 Tax=Novipirellula herctigrandis TaxID=2527986 RepID=A0A5C5ZD45_9BACT|nr:hypothetical protein CA13_65880 [Planctomycetes bacterium CA13]
MCSFQLLTGIEQRSAEQVRSQLSIERDCFVCPSGERPVFGCLATPTLAELRARLGDVNTSVDRLRGREVIGDAQTLHADAAILNNANSASNKLCLTLLGGGALGNKDTWIIDAIRRCLTWYRTQNLDAVIVSHKSSSDLVQRVVTDFRY